MSLRITEGKALPLGATVRDGGVQFAVSGAEDRLRGAAQRPEELDEESDWMILAAMDPANPYGAILPWPKARTIRYETSADGPSVFEGEHYAYNRSPWNVSIMSSPEASDSTPAVQGGLAVGHGGQIVDLQAAGPELVRPGSDRFIHLLGTLKSAEDPHGRAQVLGRASRLLPDNPSEQRAGSAIAGIFG